MGKTEDMIASLRRSGARGTADRIGRAATRQLVSRRRWDEPDMPLRDEDVFTGHIGRDDPEKSNPATSGEAKPLKIGWVCGPPSIGSGGHTTFFRMVSALQARGHECTLLLYDRDDDDVSRREDAIRRGWPNLRIDVASATGDLREFHALVASSWQTAHVVASRRATAVPFYFIQDYEPYFYPHGYLYHLAKSTYSMGLNNIALGGMVAHEIETQDGIAADVMVPFGCDREVYRLLKPQEGVKPRSGVVYYAKRSTDRRGYLLAKKALELFHAECPDEPIHVVGDIVRGWDIPVVNHGSVPPNELNRLYNEVVAGLAMSFTNVSLVAAELLAAGAVAVLNDLSGPRRDLQAPGAVWTPGTPESLARALQDAIGADDVDFRAARIAAAAPEDWSRCQSVTADYMEQILRKRSIRGDQSTPLRR